MPALEFCVENHKPWYIYRWVSNILKMNDNVENSYTGHQENGGPWFFKFLRFTF